VRRAPAARTKATITRLPAGAALAPLPAALLAHSSVVCAPPTLIAPSELEQQQKQPELTEKQSGQGWGKKVKPPSMVLDEDVNGFKASHNRKRGKGKKKVRLPSFLYFAA
jgi:splicing factor 45